MRIGTSLSVNPLTNKESLTKTYWFLLWERRCCPEEMTYYHSSIEQSLCLLAHELGTVPYPESFNLDAIELHLLEKDIERCRKAFTNSRLERAYSVVQVLVARRIIELNSQRPTPG